MAKPAKLSRTHPDRCVESQATYQQKDSLRLDRDAGIVYGVKVLGWTGQGGKRLYRRPAVEKALPLYDGAVVNLDHVTGSESDFRRPDHPVTKRFGRLKSPEIRDDGLYANLRYNTKHTWAPAFEWFVENDAEALGMSHDAILSGPTLADGKRSIESISKVFSVDIVGDPGSTKSLFESMGADYRSDASVDMSDVGDPDDSDFHEGDEHLCNFVTSVLRDKSLDKAAKLAKITAAMDLMSDDDTGEAPEPNEEETPDKELPPEPEAKKKKPMSEQAKESTGATPLSDAERLELEAFRAAEKRRVTESKAKAHCAKAELDEELVTETFLKSMIRATESEWEDMIADRKRQGGQVPKSSGAGTSKPTIDDFAKSLGVK